MHGLFQKWSPLGGAPLVLLLVYLVVDLSLLFWLKFDYLFYAIFSWFCCSVILFSYILCFHFLLCSVFTPYYSEIVLYSMAELQKKNEDGITTLFYLQKIYPGSGLYFFPISMSAERNTWILCSVTFSCDPLVIYLSCCDMYF